MTKKKLRRKVAQVLKRLVPSLSMSARLVLSREMVKQDFYMFGVYDDLQSRIESSKAVEEAFKAIEEESMYQCDCCGPSVTYKIGDKEGFEIRSMAMDVPPQTEPGTIPNPPKSPKIAPLQDIPGLTKVVHPVEEPPYCWVLTAGGENRYEDSWFGVDSVYEAGNLVGAYQRAFDLMSNQDLHKPYEATGALRWEGKEDEDTSLWIAIFKRRIY